MTAAAKEYRLLVVDDDRELLDVLSMALEDAGFTVHTAGDGKTGLARFGELEPDLVVLDLLMPGLDGMELCRRIRATHSTPVIMLTSRSEEMDRVLGLELGADDYVTKPFSTRELIARIRAALRRVALDRADDQANEADTTLERGPLVLDRGRHEVLLHGQTVALTVTEFELLWALCERPGQVCPRDTLIDRVYGEGIVVADRTIDTFVKRLRKKLAEIDASYQAIETVRAVGYRFRVQRDGGDVR
jgi:DNA-binding response OmpR family regulator